MRSMNKKLIKTSKYLSFVLRHNPGSIGLQLDEAGWADVGELIEKASVPLSRALIEETVETNDKQRFALSDDGSRIRASQGHSIDVNLGLEPEVPPEILYHGTATRFMHSIRKQGLLPGNRQFVHLSADEETARKVGSRHGVPVILTLPALQMHEAGQEFYLSDNQVWLTDRVASKFLVESKG